MRVANGARIPDLGFYYTMEILICGHIPLLAKADHGNPFKYILLRF